MTRFAASLLKSIAEIALQKNAASRIRNLNSRQRTHNDVAEDQIWPQ